MLKQSKNVFLYSEDRSSPENQELRYLVPQLFDQLNVRIGSIGGDGGIGLPAGSGAPSSGSPQRPATQD